MNKTFRRIWGSVLSCTAQINLNVYFGSRLAKSLLQARNTQENKTEKILTGDRYKKLVDGKKNTFEKIEVGEEVVLELNEPGEINTVVLREKGSRCESFSIYGENSSGERITLYENDIIDKYLYCAFDSAEITKLIFKVNKSEKNKDVKISEIKAFNVQNKADNGFRVAAYYPIDRHKYFSTHINDEALNKNLDIVTEIVLIGNVNFNRDGNLVYDKELFEIELNALKQILGDRDTRIWCCILNPRKANGKLSNKDSVYTVNNNLEKLNNNLVELCKTYGFCGVDFDWEYPVFPHNWSAYSKLLVSVGEKMHENGLLISSAFSMWGNMLNDKAKQSLDVVNVMSYDWAANKRNHHSEFYGTHYYGAEYFLKHGFKKEQLILGVPFYGNILEGGGRPQSSYNETDIKNKVDNVGGSNGSSYYYNGYNMIYSKTAYANDMGFAGVMMWHAGMDKNYSSGISLFEAIDKAQNDRIN